MIAETAALLGDSGGNRWKTAIANPPVLGTNDAQYALNLAAVELNAIAGIVQRPMSLNVSAGNPVVPILDQNGDPPAGKLLRLEDDVGRALIRTTSDWLNVTQPATWKEEAPKTPTRYIRGLDGYGTLRLWPDPDRTVVFTAYCVAEPAAMLAATHLPWIGGGSNRQDSPVQYHAALPFYAAWFSLLFNQTSRDVQLAQVYRAEFDQRAARAAAEIEAALAP